MLKHVQISPMRSRADTVSLRSSISCSSSLCGSPEPLSDLNQSLRASRASSYSSLNEMSPQTTIKIYTSCLRVDIEYKTLGIQWETTASEVVRQVLRRCKMRHRDPRLFYLSMEVTIRKAGVKTLLKLEDEARPALLQACHPKGDSRFCLQMMAGGLVRVHTSALQPTSQYKSLVIAEQTTSDELLGLLLSTYNSPEPVEQFSLYEVSAGQEFQRKLHPDDLPLRALQQRTVKGEACHFLVRRNPNYPRRRQLLPPINETAGNISASSCASIASTVVDTTDRPDVEKAGGKTPKDTEEGAKGERRKRLNFEGSVCIKCRNSFKSCEFCQQHQMNDGQLQHPTRNQQQQQQRYHPSFVESCKVIMNGHPTLETATYNPVYNIREIRTVCHSFSSLGIDKKLLDIQINRDKKATPQPVPSRLALRRRSVGDRNELFNNHNNDRRRSTAQRASPPTSHLPNSDGDGSECVLPPEQVNANGKFLYI